MTRSIHEAGPNRQSGDLAAGDPGLRLQVLTEAIACLEARDFKRAERLGGQAVSIDARDADAWHLIGVALAGQREHARAADAIRRAITLNPRRVQFHVNLGNAWYEQGLYAQAIESYRDALSLDPSANPAREMLARASERLRGRGAAADQPRPQELGQTSVVRLDLGAGKASPPGFTPLGHGHGSEIYPLSLFADNSADEIRASHCLEHFSHRQVPHVLAEWVRVLKPGGLLSIAVPDFAKSAANYLEGGAQPTEGYVMGGQIDEDDFHRSLFDRDRLTRLMLAAGLVSIEPWVSDLKDCAALSISLNLRGRKVSSREVTVHGHVGPDHNLLLDKAVALHKSERHEEAASLYREILTQTPDHADALHLLGLVRLQKKDASAALELIDRAIELDPQNASFLSNRGRALHELKRLDEALSSYDHALAIRPDYPEALSNRGGVLGDLKRLDHALLSYDRALKVRPDYPQALYNRGNALRELRRLDEAIASYDRALAIKPDYPQALYNRGNVLRDLRRLPEAIESYDRAVAVKPDHAEALVNRGISFKELKRFDEAIASYDRALAIKPNCPFVLGHRLRAKMLICDWRELDTDFSRLAQKIQAGEKPSTPFPILATPLSAALQKQCAETYVRDHYPEMTLLPRFERREHDRIRLGYFSADYRNHPVAHLMAGVFENHDRSRFEVTAFSLGPARRDAVRARLEKSFDRFIEIAALSDHDVASLARTLEIDIAIDLTGYTQDSRTGIFASRAAPIQVNYLGFPGTMGAGYIDYVIADTTLIPDADRTHYTEKVAYLPDTYQASDSKRRIGSRPFTRLESGLPEKGLVFACFNTSYKITPDVFSIWMRLLKKFEGSVLWLSQGNEAAMPNLRKEADARGVDPARLVMASFVAEPEDHLSRLRLADLVLDTVPYNAHASASDALWAGVPVLTCLGNAFPGRVAASLLKAIGLPELIAKDLGEYEALALELCANRTRLQALRERLATNRITHPLFDTARFTKHIEAAYEAMWERYLAGLAPEHIHVQAGARQASTGR
jgi:predicted O-linked N-acetylglucosamine transferase (SPINDLY family)